MTANPEPIVDPTYIRTAATGAQDPSVEATLIDGPGSLPPALRAMVEAELAAINDDTRIGALVPASIAIRVEPRTAPTPIGSMRVAPTPAVLMTAHMPSDLAFDELLDEDAAAELHPVTPLPEAAILEPRTVHEYVEPARPSTTHNGRYRAPTPTGGAESDEYLVRPVSLSAPPPSDPFGHCSLAPAFEPDGLADDDVTKTLFIQAGDDTSWGVDTDDTKPPGFITPAPRGRAVARGIGPQRYIRTSVGRHPLPKVGERIDEEIVFNAAPRPSPFVMAVLGFACIAATLTQLL